MTRALRWLVATLPPSDRVWGEALVCELDAVPRLRRARWVLGLVGLSLIRTASGVRAQDRRAFLSPAGVRTGLLIGVAAGAIIAADLAHSNLGPSGAHPGSDPLGPVLVAYAVLLTLFASVGFIRRGRGRPLAECVGTAAVCAVAIVVCAFLTALIVDNVWLSTVARQPDKLEGLARSGLFGSMRAYLNAQNLVGLIVVTPVAAGAAALLGGLGAWLRGEPAAPPVRGLGGR